MHHFGETLQIPNPEDVADALSQRIVRDAQNSTTGKADMVARRAAARALIAVAHDLFSTDHALSSSPTKALAKDFVDGDLRAHPAFVQAFTAYVGWARLSTWITAVRASHGTVLTRRDQTRAHAAQRRVTTQAEAVVHHRAAFQSLRIRLDALGIDQPLTYETLRHLLQMLPESSSTIPSPAAFVQCGGSPYDPKEPAWVRESPGSDRVLASDPAISDDVLARAWFDQWITTATISQHLAISRAHAADVLTQCDLIEVDNPHYRSAASMRLVRMSSIEAWAQEHEILIDQWSQSLARRRAQHAERQQQRMAALRAMPHQMQRITSDPAPVVCFWLSLLNRAAKDAIASSSRFLEPRRGCHHLCEFFCHGGFDYCPAIFPVRFDGRRGPWTRAQQLGANHHAHLAGFVCGLGD